MNTVWSESYYTIWFLGGGEGIRDCHKALGASLESAGKQDPGQAAPVS